MKKIIKLTEGDLLRIIKNSAIRILRETKNDDIQNGVMASEEDEDDLNAYDDDDDDFLGYLNDMREKDRDDDLRDYFDQMDDEQWIGQDDHDMTDNELYNYQ